MTLKDRIGLIKQYAFVSVTNYSTVGTGESVSAALRDYESKLRTDGVVTIGDLGESSETMQGNHSEKFPENTAVETASINSSSPKIRTSSLWQNPAPVWSLH